MGRLLGQCFGSGGGGSKRTESRCTDLRKLLECELHMTPLCPPTGSAGVSLALNRNTAYVHNQRVWQSGRSECAAAARTDASFLLPVRRRPVPPPGLYSNVVVLIWRGEEEEGRGRKGGGRELA